MKQLKWIFSIVICTLLTTACTHEDSANLDESSTVTEEILKSYPKEITIDNWEQFVEAPKEVIQHFAAKEIKQLSKPYEITQKNGFGTTIISSVEFGQIQVQNGGNANTNWLANTRISTYNFSDLTDELGHNISLDFDYGNNNNYFFSRNQFTDVMCFYFENVVDGEFSREQWQRGISVLDMVLIARHIEKIECFTDTWQYLAADVNGDGAIDEADAIELQKLVLYITDELPAIQTNGYNQPVIYFPQDTYDSIQIYLNDDPCAFDTSLIAPYYEIISCQRISDNQFDRFAVKRGDVSGNWSF